MYLKHLINYSSISDITAFPLFYQLFPSMCVFYAFPLIKIFDIAMSDDFVRYVESFNSLKVKTCTNEHKIIGNTKIVLQILFNIKKLTNRSSTGVQMQILGFEINFLFNRVNRSKSLWYCILWVFKLFLQGQHSNS